MNSSRNAPPTGNQAVLAAPDFDTARRMALATRSGYGNMDVERGMAKQAELHGFDKEQALANQAAILRREQAVKQQKLMSIIQALLQQRSAGPVGFGGQEEYSQQSAGQQPGGQASFGAGGSQPLMPLGGR